MNIQIIRTKQGTESTLSTVIVDKIIRGYMLEDTDRMLVSSMPLSEIKQLKKQDRTAIPTGRYKLEMTYSNRFKVVMPELLNVPGFGGIRIHSGNYVGDTEGCLLPGLRFDQDKNGYYRVWDSRKLLNSLLIDINAANNRKEPIWCEITRNYK